MSLSFWERESRKQSLTVAVRFQNLVFVAAAPRLEVYLEIENRKKEDGAKIAC